VFAFVDGASGFEYHAGVMNGDVRRRRLAQRRALLGRVILLLAGSLAAGLMVAGIQSCRGSRAGIAGFQPLPIPPPPPKRVHLTAAGDVMLDRGVWNRIKTNGMSHVMRDVRDRLRAGDITFVNLECPLSTVQGHARPLGSLEFCADPGTVQVLEDAGVDVVAIANNHSLDAGEQGCEDTMATLAEHDIAYAGGRPPGVAPDEITYLQAGDVVVAFLAYTDLDFAHGSMCKVDEDMHNALSRVKEARNHADVVCVSYHWGVEYQKEPTERQVELGRATIDAGADIILGHHPHVMGGVEWYHNGLILYSMGNFVFDQRDDSDGRMTSAIFDLSVTVGRGTDLVITPIRISPQEYAPRTPTAERAGAILAELARLSEERDTPLVIEGEQARASFVRSSAAQPTVAGTPTPKAS
jgi:poly-gamma-glutamate capsule biosynthesis protein CapA/YwtB (metallophosphatase superfamily)